MSFQSGSQSLNKTVQHNTLLLVGNQNVNLGAPGMRTEADLRVAGGGYIGKDFYVRGELITRGNIECENINVRDQITCTSIHGNLASFAYITPETLGEGINVEGNVTFHDNVDFLGIVTATNPSDDIIARGLWDNNGGGYVSTYAAPTPIAGQVLVTTSPTTATWQTVSGVTAVTEVNTGTGLTGGPITMTGTISLANTSVTPATYNYATLTVNQQGQLTAASNGSPVTTFSASTTGLTPSSPTSGAVTLGGILGPTNGGTGVNNGSSTITLAGDFATSGAHSLTLTTTGTTNLTLPTSGTVLTSTSGVVTTFSASTTGLTPSSATSGAVTLGGILGPTYGGTGVNNGSFTATLGGNLSTAGAFTTSGANSLTLTTTGTTNVTLPTSGTVLTSSNGVTTFSASTTGLTPSSPTSGAVTLGGILGPTYGGTGVNNGSFTATLGGNLSTAGAFTTSGANSLTLTTTGTTNLTLPTSGTVLTSTSAVTTVSAGTTGLTPSSATSGVITLGGTLNATSGGTGTSTAPTAGQILVGTSGGEYVPYTLASGTGINTQTGSGTLEILNTGVVSFSAASTGFTPTVATTGAITLGGILGPTYGGTGVNNGSFTTTLGGNLSTAGAFTTSGANSLTLTTTGTTNVTLPTSGTVLTSANGVTTFSAGTTGLTPSTATSGAVTLGGTLGATNGGTGASTYTTGDTLYASATNTLSKLPIGSTSQVLTVSGGLPSWQTPTASGYTQGTILTPLLKVTMPYSVNITNSGNTDGFAGTINDITSDGYALWISITISGNANFLRFDPYSGVEILAYNAGSPSALGLCIGNGALWGCYNHNNTGTAQLYYASQNALSPIAAGFEPIALTGISGNNGLMTCVYDGTYIWVANYSASQVSQVNATTFTFVANTVLTGGTTNPLAIAYDGTRIWVANQTTTNLISFLPASPGTQTTHSIGGVVPYSLAYDGQGFMWVLTSTGSSGLLKVNTSTGSIVQTISYASVYASTTSQINSLCFDGYNMWAVLTSSGASTVIVVSTFSNAITYTFPLPNPAYGGITFDGQFMYVATNVSTFMAFYRFAVPR